VNHFDERFGKKGQRISDFRRVCILRTDVLVAEIAASGVGSGLRIMLLHSTKCSANKYTVFQQQTMIENMEMQKAQAFWNPLESMSKRDATS